MADENPIPAPNSTTSITESDVARLVKNAFTDIKSKIDGYNLAIERQLAELRKEFADSLAKTNEQVNTIAIETETKIKKLSEKPASRKGSGLLID